MYDAQNNTTDTHLPASKNYKIVLLTICVVQKLHIDGSNGSQISFQSFEPLSFSLWNLLPEEASSCRASLPLVFQIVLHNDPADVINQNISIPTCHINVRAT